MGIYLRSFNNAQVINKTPEVVFEIGHDAVLNVFAMSSGISGSYACLVVLVWLRGTSLRKILCITDLGPTCLNPMNLRTLCPLDSSFGLSLNNFSESMVFFSSSRISNIQKAEPR